MTWYYIYSSVTGQRITDIAIDGSFVANHIYMGATEIASGDDSGSTFQVHDPVTGGMRRTDSDGTLLPDTTPGNRIELGGLHVSLPLDDPATFPPPRYDDGADVGDPENGCEIDGTPLPCTVAASLAAWIDGLPETKPSAPRDPRTLPGVIPATDQNYGRAQNLRDYSSWHRQEFDDGFVFADNVNRKQDRMGVRTLTLENGHEDSAYGWLADPMRRIVEEAKRVLKRSGCRGLFDEKTDPSRLLERLFQGDPSVGTLAFGQTVDQNGTAILANASTNAKLGPLIPQGPGLPMQSSGYSAVAIVLTSRGLQPRFGLNEVQDRALTLIHELGHAANLLRNKGTDFASTASTILPDSTDRDRAWISKFNSDLVWMRCFMTTFARSNR